MNIKVQCCGIVLMLVILYFYARQKTIRLNTEKAFLRMYCIIMTGLVTDIISLAALTHMDSLPVWLVDFACKIYISTLVLVALSGTQYVCVDIYKDTSRYRKVTGFYCIIAAIGIIMIFLLPIDKTCLNETVMYTSGPSALATYAFALFFFVATIVLMEHHKKEMNSRRREAVYIWIALWMLAAIIQFWFKELLIVGYAGAVAVVIIYLLLENPETNLDRQSGLYNQNTLLQYTAELYGKRKDFFLLSLIFSRSRVNNMAAKEEQQVRMEVIRYILNIQGAFAFKNAEDEIVILFRDGAKAEKCREILKNRFEQGWGKEEDIFVNPSWMFLPDVHVVNKPADIAYLLRYARQNSRDFVEDNTVVLDKALAERMYEEKKTEQLLADAIDYDRVEVYYQPIFATGEQRFTSAEALIRIRDKSGKIVPPNTFINVAEQNGMIIRLGEIVFEKVCRFLQEYHPKHLGLHYIEVNLSAVQCTYEHLAENFIGIMKKYEIDPSWINLEITESASVSSKKIFSENIKKLMAYGITFSLDDFGTGQSNLNYIVEMPVNIVKFDRSMISAYFENGKAKYVMDAAMHMIRGMRLKIVSEGIETKEQYDTMKELGIHYIQGYYFSKPLAVEAFVEFIQNSRRQEKHETVSREDQKC